MDRVRSVIDLAVGGTVPDLTLLFEVAPEVAAVRRREREKATGASPGEDRFEKEDEAFFARVAEGFRAIAATEVRRVTTVDATAGVAEVAGDVWRRVIDRLESSGVRRRV